MRERRIILTLIRGFRAPVMSHINRTMVIVRQTSRAGMRARIWRLVVHRDIQVRAIREQEGAISSLRRSIRAGQVDMVNSLMAKARSKEVGMGSILHRDRRVVAMEGRRRLRDPMALRTDRGRRQDRRVGDHLLRDLLDLVIWEVRRRLVDQGVRLRDRMERRMVEDRSRRMVDSRVMEGILHRDHLEEAMVDMVVATRSLQLA